VKITPAHDHDDNETGRRHGLAMPTILDDAAHVANTGTAYDGLERYAARARILEDLVTLGDLEGVQPHEMVIGRCQRSTDVVEPRLKTQWFIRTGPLAEAALAATRSGTTRILPERFEKTWEHWLVNIRDWNVSRQLWWGHRIPAWYCPDGHATVSAEIAGPDACEMCARPAAELTQDPDIFDTWFSSGLWPFSTLGWPDATADVARFYPGTVMETAYDIIFFWVARMMMLGIELMGEVPFKVVYLSGLIRDPYGQKMSKTKGNTVDPLGTIDDVGADALRFAVVHGATPGNDQRFGPAKVDNARNFGNKLWNAARYVIGARPVTIPPGASRQVPDPALLGPAERWVLSRAAGTVTAVDRAMADFGFGEVTRILYEAIWSEYCDWGIELAKVRLADEGLSVAERQATWWALVSALDTYLRLLHPVMPFITERLWAALPHADTDPGLLIVARWPTPGQRDEAVEGQVGALVELVRAVRNARADAKLEPGAWLPLDVFVEPELGEALEVLRPALERLGRTRPLRRHATRDALHEIAGAAGGLAVIAGPAEAIVGTGEADPGAVEADRARLDKELADAERLLDAARARLGNEAFTAKAPPAIVEGARTRESELADQVERLRARLTR
ncbi:MAG TPA: class I tRNA ligase family protein, partial [Candidatus Limnocylindrales bacterium]